MNVSVVISTCNAPDWLEKAIWGWAAQGDRDFELLVADDGSTPETARRLRQLQAMTGLKMEHVWQEDRGFRKSEILNKAVLAAAGDYLIFSDGECVPRRDFVSAHKEQAEREHFLSGGSVPLPLRLSRALRQIDIVGQRATDPFWLVRQGLPWSKKLLLLSPGFRWGKAFDALTTTRATFNGHNASCWKEDLLRVGGFDGRMRHGGFDRELGERLVNAGVRPKQVRHQAVCVRLFHERPYASFESWKENREIRRDVRRRRACWTEHGTHLLETRQAGLCAVAERD